MRYALTEAPFDRLERDTRALIPATGARHVTAHHELRGACAPLPDTALGGTPQLGEIVHHTEATGGPWGFRKGAVRESDRAAVGARRRPTAPTPDAGHPGDQAAYEPSDAYVLLLGRASGIRSHQVRGTHVL